MKKHNREHSGKEKKGGQLTVGLDLGDRSSRYCMVDETGEVVVEGSLASTKKGLDQVFGALARCRVALEGGNALTLDKPTTDTTGTRGDRGQRPERAADR